MIGEDGPHDQPRPAASTEFRISPCEDDWQQVLGVDDWKVVPTATGDEVRTRDLVTSLEKRYVVVELTDLAPVDEPIYFADGVALTLGEDGDDQPVSDVLSTEFGVRTFIYTKFELVSSRSK